MEQFPQGKIPLSHLVHEETLFTYVLTEVNDWVLNVKNCYTLKLFFLYVWDIQYYLDYHLFEYNKYL